MNRSREMNPTRRIVPRGPLLLIFATSMVCLADAADAQDRFDASTLDAPVRIGITGHYRIGCWTMVRSQEPGARSQEAGGSGQGAGQGSEHGSWAVETVDGAGVHVSYVQPKSADQQHLVGYAIPGSEAAPLVIRWIGQDPVRSGQRGRSGEANDPIRRGEAIVTTRFPELATPSQGPSVVPLRMPWIVALGNPLGVETIGANELLDRGAQVAVSRPTDAAELPNSVLGYDGVDLMLINASGADLLRSLSPRQRTAIQQWVLGGGHLFVTLGESVTQLAQAAPWLFELLPLHTGELATTLMDPSALETFTSSQTRLQPFRGVALPPEIGRTLITGRTNRRVSTPFASRYVVGLGRVTAIAADLDDNGFAQWPNRLSLITQLTDGILVLDDQATTAINRVTGFDDLAGQAKATLDRFTIRSSVNFSLIALLLIGLAALIGPLDFLLINRLLGRPLLGWLTLPIVVIGLSAALIAQARPTDRLTRPADGSAEAGVAPESGVAARKNSESAVSNPARLALAECNRLEIVDIDSVHGIGRGFAWSYLYSHPARRLDVQVSAGGVPQLIDGLPEQMVTAPFGYPGPSFGGIQIAGEDARLPAYRVVMQRRLDKPAVSHGGDFAITSAVRQLPIAPRSSRSLATRFRFRPNLSADVTISRRPGSELLEGSLVNPLPVDLLDGMLIYRNWVYLLPTRFRAGGQVASLEGLRQKNFRWQLSRQKALESATQHEPWDPSDFDSPARLAEMLMFHEAVGGSRYTQLRHEPLSFWDLTHLLTSDRCMLVGRLAQPLSQLTVSASSAESDTEAGGGQTLAGESLSMIRLVLPVVASP